MSRQIASARIPSGLDIPLSTLHALYLTMLRIRILEDKIAELINNGEIVCPVHLYAGQEAVATGVCANLHKDDYVFSTHRSHGHYIAKGGDMKALMAELYGRSTGCSKGRGGSMHVAAPEIGLPGSSAIVAGTIPLAVGAALAFTLRKKDNVAIAFFGDGATNEGVFYESLNFASLKKLPVIFVCENNLYSTHMPISACLADIDIRKKAEIFNMPGIRIDGNNIVDIFKTAKKAVRNARLGQGPALLECMTYRWRGHVGSNFDMDKGLRPKEEWEEWMSKCPIKRMETLLTRYNGLSHAETTEMYTSIKKEVEEAVVFAKESPYPEASELMNNVFKE